jgi:hypothetical protein
MLRCRGCGKIHRVTRFPVDQAGTPLREFLFSCIGCGRIEIRAAGDIFTISPPSRRAAIDRCSS